jgi:type I restriction enzyme S subunit
MSLVAPFEEIFNEAGLLGKAPHWKRIELKKVISIQNGYPLNSRSFSTEKGFPLIRIRDLKFNRIQTFYTEEFPKEFIVSNGDLLVGMDGDFLCYEWKGGQAVLNQRVCKLIPNESLLLKRFLFYGINGYLEAIQNATSSVTVKHLSSIDLGKIPFPIPPLPEQHRIVAKLDSLMEKVESNKQRLEKIPQLLKRFRQSVLAAAVSGRLTEEWRMENLCIENAESILQKIRKSRQNQKNRKLADIENTNENTLPDGWKWCQLDEIAHLVTDGKHGDCNDEVNSGYYFLSAKDISDGVLLYRNARQIVYKEFLETHRRTNLEEGDICVVNTGATVGKSAIVRNTDLNSRTTF